VFDPRRMSGPWLVASLLLHPALVGVAAFAAFLGGDAPARWSDEARELGGAAALASTLFFVLWFGPLPEEIGWRGYALDPLQRRLGALGASLAIGAAWALWHVPLFFLEGTFQHDLGFGSPRFWIFSASLLPLAVLITWVYNHTRRSTLSAVLVHYTGNLTGLFVEKTDRLAAWELAVLTAAAVVVTAVYGPRELRRGDR
jgi:membrane protease YdiL (CAAX protease family)